MQIRALFRDVGTLISRARQIIDEGDCSLEERTYFKNMLHLKFDAPLADIIAAILTEHNDLVLKDEGFPPDYFEKLQQK